ncbi:hypothetical protein AB4238_15430 [Shewanella sp. 10N.286.45.A1]|uniref:hypothetical protein n=1 Tax=Shewanella sp. 10N.286.45.A1 TaxID=3229694 RepID=UPI003550D780
MTSKIYILSFALLLSGCKSTPIEAIYTELDPTPWTIGYQKDFGAGNGYIREWVPKDENIKSWTKLFSIEFLEKEKTPIHEYSDNFLKKRQEQCSGTKYKILKETDFSRTYIINFPSCAGQEAQSEITRMFQGNDGLHRLSYAEKSASLSQEVIAKWNQELQNSYIVKGPNKTRIR